MLQKNNYFFKYTLIFFPLFKVASTSRVISDRSMLYVGIRLELKKKKWFIGFSLYN